MQVAVRLAALMQANPLADWPCGYVAWLSDLVLRVRDAYARREVADTEARMKEARR